MRPVRVETMSTSVVASSWSVGWLCVGCQCRPSVLRKTVSSPKPRSLSVVPLVTTYALSRLSTVTRGSDRPDVPASFTVVNAGDPGEAVAGTVAAARASTPAPAQANRTFRARMAARYGRPGPSTTEVAQGCGRVPTRRNGEGGGASSARGHSARDRPPKPSASSHSEVTVQPADVPAPVTVARYSVISYRVGVP